MNSSHLQLLSIYIDFCNDSQLIIEAAPVGGDRKVWVTNAGYSIVYQKFPSGDEALHMYTREQGQVFFILWQNWVDPISTVKLIRSFVSFIEERVETPLHSN